MALNFQSLHNIYISKLNEKKKVETDLNNFRTSTTPPTNADKVRIELLENSLESKYKHLVPENEYMLDVVTLIDKTEKGIKLNDDEYETYCQKYFSDNAEELIYTPKNSEKATSSNRCPICTSDSFGTDTKADSYICKNCGHCVPANNALPSWETTINLRTSRKSGYTKSKSLIEYLDYLQLRKKVTLENEDIERLRDKMCHIPPDSLDVKTVHIAMRHLGLSKFYNDKFYVYYLLSGQKVSLSKKTEECLLQYFYIEQFAFNYLQQNGALDRINIYVYRFSVVKLAQIILFSIRNPKIVAHLKSKANPLCPKPPEVDLAEVNEKELEFMMDIIPTPIVESDDNLEIYDSSWKLVCEFSGWKFIPSL
jgi:hypothetical protein